MTSVSDARITMIVSLAASTSIAPPATVSSLLLVLVRSMQWPPLQLSLVAVDSDEPDDVQPAATASAPTAATPRVWSISRREQPPHTGAMAKRCVFICAVYLEDVWPVRPTTFAASCTGYHSRMNATPAQPMCAAAHGGSPATKITRAGGNQA